ncbi:MAG: hypothetical protein ABIX10_07135 [Acidimicrobiales bacterium]
MAIFVTLIAGGGFVGLATSMRAERRSEKRSIASHELGIRGETSAQQRAEDSYQAFQESSQRTVSLVNDTLDLARQATERAATTMRQKAEADLDELNDRAMLLLEPVLLGDDFKEVVEDPIIRSGILELANEVTSLQGYIQSQDLELTALCFFVKGMGRHLEQASRAAIKSLRESAGHATEAERDLRVFAQFWAGYELNNIGSPGDAARTFRRAVQDTHSGSPRYFELSRIAVESDFFMLASQADGSAGYAAKVLALDDELRLLQDATMDHATTLTGVRWAIANTRGNLAYWLAQSMRDEEGWEPHMTTALDRFNEAEAFMSSLWSRFGALEAASALTPDHDRGGYKAVDDELAKRMMNRREPRSMALFSETRFIALCRIGAPAAELSAAHRDALDKLQAVDDGLTLYSQIRKHNVRWAAFAAELEELHQLFVPRAT